jgi:outer membrane protein OmpA-like peptidoglycan-associated protein
LQSFGLIVTAEPYFAVTQPSDVVVMENFVTRETTGTIEEVDAKFELLHRGQYTLNVNPAEIKALRLDKKVPLELYEARNAVLIARWTGAEKYAADTFLKAKQGLENAEGYLQGKSGKKPIGTVAREACQMAEDARIITIKKLQEENLANERQAGSLREESARSETERVRMTAEAARIAAQSEADRVKQETDGQRASAKADMDRATREKAEAEAARMAAVAAQQAAQAETEKARLATDEANALRLKAEAEKTELRAQLLRQFSLVLETRDTARGLIVNMSDVLFDTAKFSLRPGAREKLAKVAGIISGHPGLRLEVEGHTDNVGGDDYNQQLSEHRGTSVRDYLTQNGIPEASVTTKGFGKTQPVASNDTSAGRQQNRRVELVVSGEIIGTEIGSPRASR